MCAGNEGVGGWGGGCLLLSTPCSVVVVVGPTCVCDKHVVGKTARYKQSYFSSGGIDEGISYDSGQNTTHIFLMHLVLPGCVEERAQLG